MLVVTLAACGSGSKIDERIKVTYTAEAEEVIFHLNTMDYEAVFDLFDETMQEELPVDAMVQFSPLIKGAGQFKEIGNVSIQEKDELYIVVASVKYTEENRIFTITFNKQAEIAGLNIK